MCDHIIDLRTGMPAETDLWSVSVVAANDTSPPNRASKGWRCAGIVYSAARPSSYVRLAGEARPQVSTMNDRIGGRVTTALPPNDNLTVAAGVLRGLVIFILVLKWLPALGVRLARAHA
ncbi:MAG TPA: hypothetical protein VFL28_14150 [bacterium]|nr:hypothetical protein [bacterium]